MNTIEVRVDAGGLEPPEPLEQVLLALDLARPGEHVRFLVHREPVPLYERSSITADMSGLRHKERKKHGIPIIFRQCTGN